MAKTKNSLLEKLAKLEHMQWMNWAKNLIKTEQLSKERITKWEGYFIPYNELPEAIKELDRNYARKILEIITFENDTHN